MKKVIRVEDIFFTKNLNKFSIFLTNQTFKNDLKNILIRDFSKNITSGGRPKWKKLSDITLFMRRKKGGSAKPLQDTREMMNSIHAVDTPGGFFMATKMKYDYVQHFGTVIEVTKKMRGFIYWKTKKKIWICGAEINIPARPFFVVSKEALAELNNLGTKYRGRFVT